MRPLVTILVNTYNHEQFLAQCLSSIVDQDFSADQVQTIVVDDGSTDSTPEIVRSFVPRVHYIRKPNGGQVSAFHAGIAETRGQIVAFLDGDDWWHPKKLSKVVDAFARHPNAAAIGHGYFEVDERGNVQSTVVPEEEYLLSFETAHSGRIAANLRIFGGTSRLSMRKMAVDRALPVPAELPFFDNFIFTQGIAMSGAVLLPETLCYYRLHSRNLYASRSSDTSQLRRRYDLQRGLVTHLPPRLMALGVPESFISAALESERIDTDRLRLILDGGSRWDTRRIELADFRAAYASPTLGYKFFKFLTSVLALIFPPKTYYRIKRWYTEHNLRRLRARLVGAEPALPQVSKR